MQAAGIFVVRPIDGDRSTDKWVDIRVDDAVDPFKELRRLLNISLASRRGNRAQELKAQGDLTAAISEMEAAVEMYPHRDSYLFALAEWYAEARRDRDALNTLRAAIHIRDTWKAEAQNSDAFRRFSGLSEFQVLTGS